MAEVNEMEKLPEGWKINKLGNLALFINGYAFKPEDWKEEGLPIIRIEQLRGPNGKYDYSDKKLPDIYLIENGYLIFSWSATLLVRLWDRGKAYLNQHLYKVLPQPMVEKKYLKYLLEHKIKELSKETHGTTMKHITRPFLLGFDVEYPKSLPEQRKIAETIETVDNAIEKTDRIIEKHKRIKQGLMQDLLTKGIDENGQIRSEETNRFKDSPLGMIPEEWEVLELGEVAPPNGIIRGPFGGMLKKEIFVSRGYRVYEQGNAIYKSVNLGYYYIDAKKYKQMLRFALKPKDFIISCSGTIGKIFMIPHNFEKGIINQALLKITINDKKFNHKFFECFFEWEHFQNKIIDYTQGGAMPNLIGINEFKKVKFPKPPLPEQHRIASILSQIDETIEKETAYKEKLVRLKRGLMEDLLTGKVRVNNLIEKEDET